MKEKFRTVWMALTSERAMRIALLVVLCWIAVEIRTLSNSVYSGPSRYDDYFDAMARIARSIDDLRSTLALK